MENALLTPNHSKSFPPPPVQPGKPTPHIRDLAQYERMYQESIHDPDTFWGNVSDAGLEFGGMDVKEYSRAV